MLIRNTIDSPFVTHSLAVLRSELVSFLSENSVILGENELIVSGSGKPVQWLIDTRIALFHPEMSYAIASLFWEYLEDLLPFQLCCVEMTGIPLMTIVQAFAFRRGHSVNGFVIRKERKDSGRLRQIEGTVNALPIVFLDDIINRGSSIIRAAVALQNIDRKIFQVVALVDFGMAQVGERLLRDGISLKSLIKLEELGINKSSRPLTTQKESQIFREIWKIHVGYPTVDVVPKSVPCFDQHNVYHGTDAGTFYCVDANTGDVKWRFCVVPNKGKGIRSSPILYNDLVCFGAYDGVFYALEKTSGHVRWQFAEAEWIGSSPCVSPSSGKIFVGLEHAVPRHRGSLVALNIDSGEKCWEVPMASFVHGSPCFIDDFACVVVGNNDGELSCVDAITGDVRWHVKTDGAIKAKPYYDKKRRLILCGSFDKHVYAWDPATGNLVWKSPTNALIYSEPLVLNDLVYVCSTDKHLHVLRAEDGSDVFKYEAGAKLFSSPSTSTSLIYFAATSGTIFEFDPDSRLVTGEHFLSEKIANKIVCDEVTKTFYVTTVSGQLLAYRRR